MDRSQSNTLVLGAVGIALTALFLSKSDKPGGALKNYTPKGLNTGSPTDFILSAYPLALKIRKEFPQVPYQLLIAFPGLESSWGKAAPGFNFVGTKPGKDYKGQRQLLDTTEILPKPTGYKFPVVKKVEPYTKKQGFYKWHVKDYFRKFNSPEEGLRDFAYFITHGRYADDYTQNNIPAIVTKIWKDGYATDPNYVGKILKLVALIDKVIAEHV